MNDEKKETNELIEVAKTAANCTEVKIIGGATVTGATIGTLICPGMGTGIGAAIGGVCGSVATLVNCIKKKSKNKKNRLYSIKGDPPMSTFSSLFSSSQFINFYPYIGKGYAACPFKILVLGESHYGPQSKNSYHEWMRDVVENDFLNFPEEHRRR